MRGNKRRDKGRKGRLYIGEGEVLGDGGILGEGGKNMYSF